MKSKNFLTIGGRLAHERKSRVKLTQEALAAKLGISKATQINYESGASAPDANYLAQLAGLGADVLFVLTGNPTPGQAQAQPSEVQRLKLVAEQFKAASDEGKRVIEAVAGFAATKGGADANR